MSNAITLKSAFTGDRARAGIGFLLAALMLVARSPADAEQRRVYTIAVLPSAPPVTLYTQWMPCLERLSRETGYTFQLKVYDTMADFEQEIWGGSPDFIFASPIQTVVAHGRNRYAPLVRGGKPVSVRLFVRADSPIVTLADLSGKRIGFVGNKNLCCVFVRHMLDKQKDKVSYLSEYTGSTKNVIKSVLLGKNDAGAVFVPELEREPDEVRRRMRKIYDTPEIAPHPLSAHPRVPKTVRDEVIREILAIAATPDGSELLATLRLASPVVADYERDYQELEDVDVVGLTDWGR